MDTRAQGLDRRGFLSTLAAAGAAIVAPRRRAPGVSLYAAVGRDLAHYEVDVAEGALVRRGTITLAAPVQYAWPHASGSHLYVASSDGVSGTAHALTSLRIDPATGALERQGRDVSLRARPIHVTTDVPSEHALVAYNSPSGVSVHRIERDGTLGAEVPPRAPIEAGAFAHQIRVAPANDLAILVARGDDATATRREHPGALEVLRYDRGVLSRLASVAPNGGVGFGPRHLDFRPTRPWIHVADERANRLHLFAFDRGGVEPAPRFSVTTLRDARNVVPGQRAGAIHVHPSGRWVYVANRGNPTTGAGENTIAVYSVDQHTGEPSIVQHVETRGIEARTFDVDPSGRLLVVGNRASLATFRVGDDGTLAHARTHDLDVGTASLFWTGMAAPRNR